MKKMTTDEVFELIKREREYQNKKWGRDRTQSIPGFIAVIEGELNEAKHGWLKNVPAKHSSLSEILQIAAVAVACIEEHGAEGN